MMMRKMPIPKIPLWFSMFRIPGLSGNVGLLDPCQLDLANICNTSQRRTEDTRMSSFEALQSL